MDISVVTGTYNRISHLRRMVASVRNSIGIGLDYEIVIVDGGSTDGTLDWCKSQDDITLIQHGKLLGAIRAFNDGCKMAKGEYVIIANDDIEFIHYSILHAYAFMQDDPGCGVGCFKQDRNGKKMHVEVMPAVAEIDGQLKQVSVPYGQVCIVPRWLGEEVGWWGNTGAKTYGGDNELSCNVLERGYQILPLPCACIHDFVVEDDLRDRNHKSPEILYKDGKTHPDTEIWLNKWKNEIGVGPKIPNILETDTPIERKLRFHYTPIFEKLHAKLQRTTKVTLRKELQKIGSVHECDYMSNGMEELLDSAYTFDPDVFVMQVHSGEHVDLQTMLALKENHPDAKFFNWNGDYHPSVLMSRDYLQVLKLFDVAAFVTTEFHDWFRKHDINPIYLQAGFEDWCDDDYVPYKDDVVDFTFLGNGYSHIRLELAKVLVETGYEIGADTRLVGGWPAKYEAISTLYNYKKNYQLYQSSRFVVSDQQWPQAVGYVSDRLMHSLRSGSVVLQQWFAGMEEMLGLKHGKNVLVWRDFDDLRKLMKYCMKLSDEEVRRIGKAGKELVMENFTWKDFAYGMLDSLDL